MADPMHPVNADWELFDPVEFHPPRGGQALLLLNAGGSLIVGPWDDTCLAWGYKPKVPASVKARASAQLLQKMQDNADELRGWAA